MGLKPLYAHSRHRGIREVAATQSQNPGALAGESTETRATANPIYAHLSTGKWDARIGEAGGPGVAAGSRPAVCAQRGARTSFSRGRLAVPDYKRMCGRGSHHEPRQRYRGHESQRMPERYLLLTLPFIEPLKLLAHEAVLFPFGRSRKNGASACHPRRKIWARNRRCLRGARKEFHGTEEREGALREQ